MTDIIYHYTSSYGGPSHLTSSEVIFKHPGAYSPVLVQTNAEKDYLDGLCLLYGKEVVTYVRGTEPRYKGDLPFTFLTVTLDLTSK